MIQFPFNIENGKVLVETDSLRKIRTKINRVLRYSVRDLPFASIGAGITQHLFSVMPDKSTQSLIREQVVSKITAIDEVESANIVFQKESKNSYKMVVIYTVNGQTLTLNYEG